MAWADAPDGGSGMAGGAADDDEGNGSTGSDTGAQGGASSGSSGASGNTLRQTSGSSSSSASTSGSAASSATGSAPSGSSSAGASSQGGSDRGYVGPWYALNKTYVVDVEERFDSTAEEQYFTSAAQTGLIIGAAAAAFLAVLAFLRAHRVKKRASKGRR